MNTAARVVGSDVVAGRKEFIRGGRGREGRGGLSVAPRWSSDPLRRRSIARGTLRVRSLSNPALAWLCSAFNPIQEL
jgi:hypothetical protein